MDLGYALGAGKGTWHELVDFLDHLADGSRCRRSLAQQSTAGIAQGMSGSPGCGVCGRPLDTSDELFHTW